MHQGPTKKNIIDKQFFLTVGDQDNSIVEYRLGTQSVYVNNQSPVENDQIQFYYRI